MSTWSSTTTPGFYEWLRTHIGSQDSDDKRAVVSSDGDSSIYQVGISHSNNSTTYRLAELKSFLRFSDKSKVAPALRNEGFAVLLALHHFNNMRELGHPVLEQRITSASDVALCDVKLTMELFDGQLSARTTTRIFSSIINMPKTFLTPPIAAVIGASISSETMPLAVFTGVHNIPQVSASATSTVFDDKEQFPLFGRTTTNTIGEAAVAAQFFHSIGSTHVAVIFGTDTYINAMYEGFIFETAKLGIQVDSLVYTYASSDLEAKNSISWLLDLKYRHVFVLGYEETLEPLMNAAYELGAVGPEYLYVFPCFDVFNVQESLRARHGSPLARSLHGIGLIQLQSGATSDRVIAGKPILSSKEETTVKDGYDRFRLSWRNSLNDSFFVDHVRSKLPASLNDMTGFDRFGDFTDNPNGFLSFLYDAVTAIGLSMCQAGENASFFSGVDVFEKFRHLDFEGASGRNRILPTSGTREFTTISFVMWNVRIAGVDTDGFSVIEYVPSYIFANNTWNEVPGNRYEFAGGSTSPPGSIPPVPFDYNYIGQTARFGSYIFMGIVMIAAILSLIWMFVFRHNRIVYSAQPMYLIMVCFGAVMASAAILPLALEEDTVLNSRNLDRACMGVPWLYFVGISIVLSGLLAKTKAVFVAYVDPEIEAVQVSVADVLTFASFYVSLNVGTLAVWNLVSPLEWTRVIDITRDTFDRPLESYGLCDSNGATAFIAAMVCLNVGFLSVGTYWAYRIRNVATEHNESRYIGMVIAAILQAWLMAGPILIALHRYPSYTFFVKTGVIVTTSGVGVGLVFCPKIYAIYKESKDPLEPNSHFLESTEQPRCEMAPSAASNFFYSNSQDYPESINIMHSRKLPRSVSLNAGLSPTHQVDTRNDSKTSDKFGTHADDSNEKDENDMSLDRKARFAITKNKRHSEIVFGSLWTVDEHDNDCSSNNTGGIDGTLEVALKVPSARDSNNKYAIQRRHSL